MKKKLLYMLKGVIFCFVLCVVLANIPMICDAAVKKVTCNVFDKRNDSSVLKGGKTYKIVNKNKEHGFLRFKASKTKVYTFIVSDYRTLGVKKAKDNGYGYILAYDENKMKPDRGNSYPESRFWETIKYGDDDIEGTQSLDFASKKYSDQAMAEALKWATIVNDETGETLVDDEIANDYPRTTNEATMKLKKGEVIYLQFGNMVDKSLKNSNKGFSCTVKIK